MNNFSLLAANRITHLKIVVVALVFATLVVGIGFTARVADGSGMATATVVNNGREGIVDVTFVLAFLRQLRARAIRALRARLSRT